MEIKELFDKAEGGTLTYEQFVEASGKSKFVDLSAGGYISVAKHEDEITKLNSQVKTLKETLETRDTDLKDLQSKLKDADGNADKLKTLSDDLSTLQSKYEADTKAYQEQLSKQAYEFAVSEFANGYKFTSKAAKKDFIREMTEANLKLDDKGIVGGKDFYERYASENKDAFVVDTPKEPSKPTPQLTTSTTEDVKSNHKHSLSELMSAKNANPNATITFD